MVNHGLSHGFAALVCAQSAGVLAEVLKIQMPVFYQMFYTSVASLLASMNWKLSAEFSINLLLIVILGFIWGVAFKVLNQPESNK